MNHLASCVQKVATGPEYSKDLSYEDAHEAMLMALGEDADPVQVAIFLIALRMKRETSDENNGILQALIDVSTILTADVEEVLDLSDPYDGFLRGVPMTPFLPAVLSACGVNTVSHGVESVGPKFGATHHRVLKAAGVNVNLRTEEAVKQLESVGWCYVDQSQFSPKLHDLIPLRQRMIKRQVLSTVESLIGPIRGKNNTHIMTGFVHKAYPPMYAALSQHAGFDSGLFVRGLEGGIMPSLQQAGRYFSYSSLEDKTLNKVELSPADVGVNEGVVLKRRAVAIPNDLLNPETGLVDGNDLAKLAAELGLNALQGEKGMTYDGLVYTASLVLHHLNRVNSLKEASEIVRDVLDNGNAYNKFRSVIGN